MKTGETEPGTGNLKPAIGLLLWLTLCYSASFVGYLGSSQGLWFWYVGELRPGWDLPTWFYTPAWTVVYAFWGIASWNVARSQPAKPRSLGLAGFASCLILSTIWPWSFFAWHRLGPSLWLGVAMLLVCLCTAGAFWRVSPKAGKLSIIPVLWVAYLVIVNYAILKLNP